MDSNEEKLAGSHPSGEIPDLGKHSLLSNMTSAPVLAEVVAAHLHRAATVVLGESPGPIVVNCPRRAAHYATPLALALGPRRGQHPRELAERIVAELDTPDLSAWVSGPGFINVQLAPAVACQIVRWVLRQ